MSAASPMDAPVQDPIQATVERERAAKYDSSGLNMDLELPPGLRGAEKDLAAIGGLEMLQDPDAPVNIDDILSGTGPVDRVAGPRGQRAPEGEEEGEVASAAPSGLALGSEDAARLESDDEDGDGGDFVNEDPHLEKLRQEKRARVETQMKEIFDLYAHEGQLEKRDFGTTVRSLDLNPSQKDVQAMLAQFQRETVSFDEYRGIVTDVVMSGSFKGSVMVKDSEDTILKAFEFLDSAKKGYIETSILMELMRGHGECFSEKEFLDMTHAQEDPEMQLFRYEDFAAKLAQ